MGVLAVGLIIFGLSLILLKGQDHKKIWGLKFIFWSIILVYIQNFTRDTSKMNILSSAIILQVILGIAITMILTFSLYKKKE